jgi:hypothetical protein
MWAFGKARVSNLCCSLWDDASEFIYACFGWDRSLYAYGGLAIDFISYLISWLLACYLFVVSCDDSLLSCKSWHNDEYNCLNTCLYTLWSTLILNSCIASHSSLRLCLMRSLPKGEKLCTKLVELMLIGWLREETWKCLSKGERLHWEC